jgi:predicted amidohydrolase YtcJ
VKSILLYNAHFFDFRKPHKKIQAIQIRNGIIEKIYTKKPKLPRTIKQYDLKGNYVIPGFIDSHTHLISLGIERQRINLEKCKSLNDCLEKLRAGLTKGKKVIFASNWDESNWSSFELENLNRYTLDKISKEKPIIMRRICGHFAVVNSRGLSCISNKWHTVDRKNGHLYEDIALNLNDIFKPDKTMLQKALKLGTSEALKKGITSVHEIIDIRRFRLLQIINRNRGLKLRFSVYILLKHFKDIQNAGLSSGLGDDFLRFSGIKIFLDGSIGAKTAALTNPYVRTRRYGKILINRQKLEQIASAAKKHDIQLMIHTIGDRATAQALEVLKKIITRTQNPLRHRLEHLEILNQSLIKDIADLDLICSMQPNFARKWQRPGNMYERYLGNRYKTMNCFKQISDAGVKLVFGSDCMPLDPLFGFHGAIHHPFACGRLKPESAFRNYTAGGAYATFDENKKGIIEKGFLADLVVIDNNLFTQTNMDRIKILMTMVNGDIVYQKKL